MPRCIKYYSLLEPSGYGLAAIANIEALLAQGIKVYWTPLICSERGYQPWVWGTNPREKAKAILSACIRDGKRVEQLLACLEPIKDYQRIVMHLIPEYWPQLIEPDQVHIGCTVWETTQLPQHFPALINRMDRVLVPSQFNVSIFKNSGVEVPVHVVPHILNNQEQFQAKRLDDDSANFVFYTINTWTARKAIWALVHCYLQAFTANDRVELRIKTSFLGRASESDPQDYDTQQLLDKLIEQYPAPAKVRLIRSELDLAAIQALHHSGDCYVSTTHSEGWGLGAFEAAASGNPVIMTGWGGQLDFLSSDLSYLINYTMVDVEDAQSQSYGDTQQWASVDEGHTMALMKEAYRDLPRARIRAAKLAENIKQQFSLQTVGKQLAKAIFS